MGSAQHELIEFTRDSVEIIHPTCRMNCWRKDFLDSNLSILLAYEDRRPTWGDGNKLELAAACRLSCLRKNVYREENAIPVDIHPSPLPSSPGLHLLFLPPLAFISYSLLTWPPSSLPSSPDLHLPFPPPLASNSSSL